MPWYGYSLGAWTDEDEKEAERAVKVLFRDGRKTNPAATGLFRVATYCELSTVTI
jgi:hypothetical protein